MRVDWRTVKAEVLTPLQVASKLYNAAESRAGSRGLKFDLSFNLVLSKVEAGRCEVTGIPFDMRCSPAGCGDLPFRASLDRIDNMRGYHDDNVQVVCKMYNTAKQTWSDEDVMAMAVSLVSHQVGLVLAYKKEQAASPPLDE